MKWLLWREYRFSRLVLIAGTALLLLPYAIAGIVVCWPWRPEEVRVPNPGEALFGAAIYSLALSQFTLALLGGNAIAGERADRSAEFLAYLPLSRQRRLAAKLCLALAAVALIWGLNLSVLQFPLRFTMARINPREYAFLLWLFGYTAITGLTFFGVAFLISSLQSSPTFAVCGGVVSPIAVFMMLYTPAWFREVPNFDRYARIGYPVICPIVAVVCFSIGTWYYLRRVEP